MHPYSVDRKVVAKWHAALTTADRNLFEQHTKHQRIPADRRTLETANATKRVGVTWLLFARWIAALKANSRSVGGVPPPTAP
ncbi:unnamed protein product [Gadus morhua 'NCC']